MGSVQSLPKPGGRLRRRYDTETPMPATTSNRIAPRVAAAASPLFRISLCLALAAIGCMPATAQCTPQWQTGFGLPGTNGAITASHVWDTPAGAWLVIGGQFTKVLNQQTGGIAARDLTTGQWQSLGITEAVDVRAIATMPNGDLVIGGEFVNLTGPAGGINRIARWDGTTWHAVSNLLGPDDAVQALLPLPNGDLVAGGEFRSADGVPCNRIARWNGTAWAPLGAGMDATVYDLQAFPSGDILAAGEFLTVGTAPTNGLGRWNGTSWQSYAPGLQDATVQAIALESNGDVIVGGAFWLPGSNGTDHIARWNGNAYQALGAGVDFFVRDVSIAANGDVFAGGDSLATGSSPGPENIARWNGTWSALGQGVDDQPYAQVESLVHLPNGDLLVAGRFASAGGPPATNIATWNTGGWSPMGTVPGVDNELYSMTVMSNGDLVVAGSFTYADGTLPVDGIALHDGIAWQAIGGAVDGSIFSVLGLQSGQLIAAGDFTSIDGVPANRIALWNGTTWLDIGDSSVQMINAVEEMPNGTFVAAGFFTFASGRPFDFIGQWNGTSWSAMGAGVDRSVNSLTVTPQGDMVCAGWFQVAGGISTNGIARWDGATWHSMNAPNWSNVIAVQAMPDGRVVASGPLTQLRFGAPQTAISIYDPTVGGGAWGPIATQTTDPGRHVSALALLPNGDLIAAGSFTELSGNGRPDNAIARWDGFSWQPLGQGIRGSVTSLAVAPNGTLNIGGYVTEAGGEDIRWLTTWTPPCPAMATTIGSICAGSGGDNRLAATSLPWLGADYRATATGMASGGAIALSAYSLAPISLPLSNVFAQAGAGCELSVVAEFVEVLLPTAGSVAMSLTLPNDPNLAGRSFVHQVVPFEFDLQGNLALVTSTNGLELTVGTYR